MSAYPAGQVEANGVTVPIMVNDRGDWSAEFDGRKLSYPVREKLENALKRLTKRAAIVVEVSVVKIEADYHSARGTRATATGIHGANGNVLVTLHHGGHRGDTKEQISVRYGSQAGLWFGGDVTDEQIAEYSRLRNAAYEAQQAVRTAEARLSVDLLKTVERAIEARGLSEGE